MVCLGVVSGLGLDDVAKDGDRTEDVSEFPRRFRSLLPLSRTKLHITPSVRSTRAHPNTTRVRALAPDAPLARSPTNFLAKSI